MQFISFCLFTLLCGYSLVLSAPVNKAVSDSQEAKHQKATAIASRILKEMAGEQVAPNQQDVPLNNEENKDTAAPVTRPAVEKVESHVSNTNDDSNDEDFDFTPSLEDLYQIYGNRYAQLADDEESSSEGLADDDYYLPISTQQLLKYLAEQEESDEQLTPVIHTPVMDDSVMTAEDHLRRRRAIY